ncbi:hypothetical protein B2G71_13075 [Novosphingobium sp. PC22D]|uniref:hypothetical protein n=1 Tax=Novosphingobium sp. PC22D TaxID=1962403 RepID=UPI000BF0CE5B|nr:hypothetical protein [Novosphingobium sp. PC22D]PEQ12074.1 hypothetical protein B2G71_13075 [Novosphingobium sp. PC22D]
MATGKTVHHRERQPSRWKRNLALLALLALVLALAVCWRSLAARATIDASVAARVGCACRYVAQRDLDVCEGDLGEGSGFVFLSEDAAAKQVIARVPLLAHQTASYSAEAGCRLEPWER